MWLVAFFDLPVMDKQQRRLYTRFRKVLLKGGFSQLQLSVYARYCSSEDAAEVHRKRIQMALPPEGEVRLLRVTSKQFGKMDVFFGKLRSKPEQKPDQLVLF